MKKYSREIPIVFRSSLPLVAFAAFRIAIEKLSLAQELGSPTELGYRVGGNDGPVASFRAESGFADGTEVVYHTYPEEGLAILRMATDRPGLTDSLDTVVELFGARRGRPIIPIDPEPEVG